MTQTTQQTLTRAEVIRVFALYIEADCISGEIIKKVSYVMLVSEENCYYQLLLTPLSKITDEDALQVAKMNSSDVEYHTLEQGRGLVLDYTEFLGWDVYQFLISKSYAVPLWFGLHHWANGKNAIELGIAIER